MSEKKGTKGLELWCRKMTEGYPGVKIDNMTTSWRDGLGFCAIIHHFRPDLIDFAKLNKDDVYHNNELAFRVAERHLGIPALLEPEDMVEYSVPDRLSILTYLSQFYQAFAHTSSSSPARAATKRPSSSQDRDRTDSQSSSPTQVSSPIVHKIRREPCKACGLPVFIAERLNVSKYVYHRTCFRCARCNSQLTLANYYETENNQFCCEVCPDEEKTHTIPPSPYSVEKNVISRSLSDEEKTAHLKKFQDIAAALNEAKSKADSLSRDQTARASFIHSQIEHSELESEEDSEDDTHVSLIGKSDLLIDSEISDRTLKSSDIKSSSSSKELTINLNSSDDSINVSHKEDRSEKPEDVSTKDETLSVESPEISPRSIVRARLGLFESLSNDSSSIKKADVGKKLLPNETRNKDMTRLDISKDIISPLVSKNNDNEYVKDDIVGKIEQESDDLSIEVDSSIVKVEGSVSDKTEIEVLSTDFNIDNTTEDSSKALQENPCFTSRESEHSIVTEQSKITQGNEDESSKDKQVEIVKPEEAMDNKNEEIDENYPQDLNPFGDSEEDNNSKSIQKSNLPVSTLDDSKISLNPFGDSGDEEQVSERKASLNPFEDDEDEEIEDAGSHPPLPARRKKIDKPKSDEPTPTNSGNNTPRKPMPTPRSSKRSEYLSATSEQPSLTKTSATSSTSSLNSTASQTIKKKKPAPKPPPCVKNETESEPISLVSLTTSLPSSPKLTPRRKAKKAPPPPNVISTIPSSESFPASVEDEKTVKDEANRSKQSQTVIDKTANMSTYDKSTHGKWKRRKAKAPPRPVPVRRIVKPLPMHEINTELQVIEIQQQGLEKQGVKLEQIIRERCEGSGSTGTPDDELPQDVEDMILQLFELVNEKNELFRKQAELMYLRRQQKLEEEQADIEYQIRCLMMKPEVNITDSDKETEDKLINRLVEIVERRNEIIDCLEMDRLREVEEDNAISNQLNIYTLKREEQTAAAVVKKPKKFRKKYWKEKKSKSHKVDLDKDIDESEAKSSPSKQKDKKKKFSIF